MLIWIKYGALSAPGSPSKLFFIQYVIFIIRSFRCFQRVGIGHFALIESYLSVLDGAHGKSDEKRLQLLSSVSFILVEWTKLAAG